MSRSPAPGYVILRLNWLVAHIDAVQIEYSPFCLSPEQNGMLDTCRELGVAVVAFSPLGAGFLTGKYTDPEHFKGDLRQGAPRFQGDALQENLKLLRAFEALAAEKGCTSSQLALAWVAKQGAIPIPGTKSASRLEENWGAASVVLDDSDMVKIRECINVGAKGERSVILQDFDNQSHCLYVRWGPEIMGALKK